MPEIQSDNAQEIVTEKLKEAFKHQQGEFLVEDTSLELDCLQGLPGPFIKFFLKKLGPKGVYEIADKYQSYATTAKTIIGYAKSPDELEVFVGEVRGKIVAPSVKDGFGWDPIFLPDGYEKTYAEMTTEEKVAMSHRTKAFEQLLKSL